MPRILGVDVANYQPESLAAYYSAGAKYVIIKLTEGLGYLNPKSRGQIKSAHAHHMYVHAYHFATFSHSVSQAKAEAKHFVARAETLNISKNRYLWLDWEPGDGNSVVSGTKNQNTKAIIAFMTVIKQAGYKTGLYASSSILRSYVDTAEVIKQFGTCLWVASYPTAGATNKPNFNYFPSMDGVAIWQFTDNWHGLSVDGDINVIDLKGTAKKCASKSKWLKRSGTFILGEALKIHTSPHINSPAIAKLQKGSMIKYDATLQGPLRLWLRQPRNNGKYGYVVGKDKYGKKLGKFK